MCGQCRTFRASKHVRSLRFSMAAGVGVKTLKHCSSDSKHSNKSVAMCAFDDSPASQKGSCEHTSVSCMLPQRSRPAHLHSARVQSVTATSHEAGAKAEQQGCSPSGNHSIATPDVSGAADSAFAPDWHLPCTSH